jgi:hypothetical protein
VNLGIAIDVPGKDGARGLGAQHQECRSAQFREYVTAFDDLVARARHAADARRFPGPISLTIPNGPVSSARLMMGQGAIVAAGTIDYPPISGRRRRDRAVRHQQGDALLHLRCASYGARSAACSWAGCKPARCKDGFYEEVFNTSHAAHAGALETDRNPPAGMNAARLPKSPGRGSSR